MVVYNKCLDKTALTFTPMVDVKGKITGTKISLKFKEEDVIK